MASYNPAEMENMYDQMNRFYEQMGQTYDTMPMGAPGMTGGYGYGPLSSLWTSGDMPRFFEEWDDRRGSAPYQGGDYDTSRPSFGYAGASSPSGYAYGPRPGFGRGYGGPGYGAGFTGAPVDAGRRYELREVDGEYVCICELPGFERSDIECTYEDGVFYIDAYRDGSQDSDNIWMRRSRRVSERVPLPRQVAVDDITASYRKGVLEVRMPLVGGEGRDGQSITIHD
ncbi:Hsp20/alpha crystallin family protein [Haloarchaeobius sp. DT45]|uniref:Hsp20/alpha crystallin family protein n=1 Tax=Haloarchaeobius sp. DT45 TaxID=3446116 RepID=UPI003F6D38DF